MALAPGLNRRPGMFGATVPMMTETRPTFPNAPQQPAMTGTAQPLAPKKGFDWGKLIGVVGDSLSILGGGQASYVPNLIDQRNRQQAMAYAEQQHQRRRLDDWADWQQKQEWERNNPKPRNPTTFEQILDAAGIQGEERVGLLRRKAENDAAGVPVGIDVQNPDGSVTRQYVRPGTLGGGMVPPQAPVGKLKPYGGQPVAPAGNFR